MSSLRSEKIADELRKEISLIINKETKDPRLQNINVTAVKVSDDIGIATVFYTLIGESIIKDQSSIDSKVLKKFSGMVRSKLSKTMQIRRVPIINFRFDESIEYSDNIETLLNNLK
jgi:ribosome-binding factor A